MGQNQEKLMSFVQGWGAEPRAEGFLGQALTSRNGGVSTAPAGGAASSFGEHASMGKGTYEYDGSKEPQ